MRRFYLLPVLMFLSACTSGSIFGNTPSETTPSELPPQAEADRAAIRPDYVPYRQGRNREVTSKQIYTVLASRAANKMLMATAANYAGAEKPSLYISAPVIDGKNVVPDHAEYAAAVTKDIIAGAHSYSLVQNKSGADYLLEISVRGSSVVSRGTSVIIYKLVLKDQLQNEKGAWVETLSPIINDDKSWW